MAVEDPDRIVSESLYQGIPFAGEAGIDTKLETPGVSISGLRRLLRLLH
jgi:hypothetical protein